MIFKLFLFCYVILETVHATHVDLNWNFTRPAFDQEIYQNALDPEVCREQLQYIRSNTALRFKFLEAGMKLPRGIFSQFNTQDWGLYDSCLEISENINTSVIEGKYCQISATLNSPFVNFARTMNLGEVDHSLLSDENFKEFKYIERIQSQIEAVVTGDDEPKSRNSIFPTVRMAICVPKTCTTQEGLRGLLFNLTVLGFHFEDQFCRLKNDKPWVPADYVAITILSLIGFLTIVSTSYDLFHTFIFKKDPKSASTVLKSFSMYTNGKRLTTFTHNPNNLNCVDGIRAISMFWIVAGHTYLLIPAPINIRFAYIEYIFSLNSLWITAAPYTVDTFLLLAGMLLVYTTIGKFSGRSLLKNLHLFYLNRLLRMFPLLATLVLLQASVLHRITDGPNWMANEANTNICRTYWWTTLLYIQNYVNPREQCLRHSWYLAIDIQCYIVSPIILYWVLNKNNKRQAWGALTFGVLASLTICSVYCFIKKFPGWIMVINQREDGESEYQLYYYFNTIARAPPFFFGMFFGYILYLWKGKQPIIPRRLNVFLWILSGGVMLTLIYTTHLMKDFTWDYFIVDDLMNSFSRTIWAAAVAWMIFACQHGYGGPINWFLCLDIWKLPSRISYAIYLFHYHIQFVLQGYSRQPIIFSDAFAMYNFFAQVLITYVVSFGMTLLIDSPCSVLVKLIIGDGPKRKQHREIPDKVFNNNTPAREMVNGNIKDN